MRHLRQKSVFQRWQRLGLRKVHVVGIRIVEGESIEEPATLVSDSYWMARVKTCMLALIVE